MLTDSINEAKKSFSDMEGKKYLLIIRVSRMSDVTPVSDHYFSVDRSKCYPEAVIVFCANQNVFHREDLERNFLRRGKFTPTRDYFHEKRDSIYEKRESIELSGSINSMELEKRDEGNWDEKGKEREEDEKGKEREEEVGEEGGAAG